MRSTGKSVVATSIRGTPLLDACVNPFPTLAPTDASETNVSGNAPTIDAPVENLLERMHRRFETAAATSSVSPNPSLSGLSSIRATATNADTTPKQAEHYRLDRTADTPPLGFYEMASVTVRIPGSEEVTIVGKVLNLSVVSPVMPMSIGSVANLDTSPLIDIVEPHAELSVEIPSAT